MARWVIFTGQDVRRIHRRITKQSKGVVGIGIYLMAEIRPLFGGQHDSKSQVSVVLKKGERE